MVPTLQEWVNFCKPGWLRNFQKFLPEELGRCFCGARGRFYSLISGSSVLRPVLFCEIVLLTFRTTCELGTMVAFCPELTRIEEAKSLAEDVLRFGSVLAEAKVSYYADFKKTVAQYLAFNKKLLKSWGPRGSVSYITNLIKMWVGLDWWKKSPGLREILDCLLCLVISSPYSFDIEIEVFVGVDYKEGLTVLRCSRSWFWIQGVAASVSVSTSLVQLVHESMLMRERLVVSSRLSP